MSHREILFSCRLENVMRLGESLLVPAHKEHTNHERFGANSLGFIPFETVGSTTIGTS